MEKNASENLRCWAQSWDIASERLERMRAERLCDMTDADAREMIARIFSGPTPPRVERETGLIEQQRLFRKLA